MSNFTVVIRTAMENTDVSVVEIGGVLDINAIGDFETKVDGLLRKKLFKLVINMEKLTYISSAGMGYLVGNIKEVRRNKGDIKLVGVNADIYRVFELLDFPSIFQFFKIEREAVQKY